jgi:hypothetical protein
MHIFLFILYFFVLCMVVARLHFFKRYIRTRYVILLFALHVAAGCFHNWIAFRYFPGHGDIWVFFEEGIRLRKLAIQHPASFFTFLNHAAFNIADTQKPVLDIQYQFLQRINVILNIFSFDNIYINTLFFSLPVFAGTIALFNVFYKVYRQPLTVICSVLLPSVLFWTSVVYKDGLFYMAIGYFFYFLLLRDKSISKKVILLVLCTAIMWLSRANALATLFPAVLFLLLTEKGVPGRTAFTVTLAAVALTIVILNGLLPAGILTAISDRQKDFQSLAGNSRIALPVLQPSVQSLLHVLPAAIINGFFQPFPGAGGKAIYIVFSAELIGYWLLILVGGWLLIRKRSIKLNNFDLACLLFAVPGMIMIGFIVPFAGAIIRYRSIYLPFLVVPFVNIISSYPAGVAKFANKWLENHLMAPGQ